MALTVFLVRVLNPNGHTDTSAIYIASAYYAEKVSVLSITQVENAQPDSHPIQLHCLAGNLCKGAAYVREVI